MDRKISKQNLLKEQDENRIKIIKRAGPNKSKQGGKFSQKN